jgi:3-methyl-2-oxobutanoate hydroxymethyltransferase
MEMKKRREVITHATAYDYPTALLFDKAGIDMINVGDSLGMIALGYESTVPVTMDEMLHHCRAVTRGAKNPFVWGDMPFMSFNVSAEEAVKNAGRFMKEGGVDGVKLEGGKEFSRHVQAITEAGIPVHGHIGLKPQTSIRIGGLSLQGATAESAKVLIQDAKALEKAGAVVILLEFVASEVAKIITEGASVPIIGVGAGPHCDGQALVTADLLGIFEQIPRHAKPYANLHSVILDAFTNFRREVKGGEFPTKEQTFHMKKGEYEKLTASIRN